MDPFRCGTENKKAIVIPFMQICRMKIGSVGPCYPNRLSKLLLEFIQIEFQVLVAYQHTWELWVISQQRMSYLEGFDEAVNPPLNLGLFRGAQIIWRKVHRVICSVRWK